MAQMDPSSAVPQDLMPHVHLTSCHRYPTVAHIDPNEVAKWLIDAPRVARDQAAFFWTYLDKPADGTIFLTWQPIQRLGNNCASDGYVWAPPEQLYKHDLQNGLILEIYYHRAGYMPGEQYAMHARRRFRLVPAPGHPNPPQVDISLFIVHWGPADPNDRMPVNVIPYDERINVIMQQRAYLLRGGQIRRKEFMLGDRVHWPTLPDFTPQQAGRQMPPRGVPQQMAYPTQATPGPPAKRARHSQSQAQQAAMPGMPGMEKPLDDEEDSWRGDIFDHLTPREISMSRYQQNHEWMEEILSSPYRINQITPVDLGLGLKGELAPLTKGIFAAQDGDGVKQTAEKPYVGRLDPGQADEFRKRVNEHIEATKAEIEKMKAEHDAQVAEFKKSSIYSAKEKELRHITEGSGPEIWRVEGSVGGADDDSGLPLMSDKSVDDVVKDVEQSAGRTIEGKANVKRIQEGGYQPPAPEPPAPAAPAPGSAQMSRQPSQAASQASGIMVGESDIDMGNTAAGLLDQMGTGMSSTSTPVNNFPTPQAQASAAQSNAATPLAANSGSPAVPAPAQAAPETVPEPSADVSMGGTEAPAKEPSPTEPDQGTGSGDWVVVPKGGATPDAAAAGSSTPTVPAAGTPAAAPEDAAAKAAPAPAPAKPASAAATPAGSVSFDNNDFSSLGDLDTAGDALASFDTPAMDGSAGELGEGLDLNMDVEDSAFGDAFHGVDSSGTPGNGGDGNGGQDM